MPSSYEVLLERAGPNLPYIVSAILFLLSTYAIKLANNKNTLPLINPRKWFELTDSRRLLAFLADGSQVLRQGKTLFRGEPYKMFCAEGEVIVLPTQLINELRNDPNFDFFECAKEDALSYIPGLDPFAAPVEINNVIAKHLTKVVGKITKPLMDEAKLALEEELPECSDWSELSPHTDLLPIISRVSTRVFMGESMCRNKNWVSVTSDYARMAFETSFYIRAWPKALRSYVHWFMPSAYRLRARLNDCRQILKPIVDERDEARAKARASGKPEPVYDDAMEWIKQEQTQGEMTDPAVFQICLSLVAIHTTTDLLHETMLQLAWHPELVQPLRDEVVRVLSAQGIQKTALSDLKLMDSVLKEVQRIKPVILATFRRQALKDVTLSNGLRIRKGQRVLFDTTHMRDAAYYDAPDTFDGYRFLRMREAPETRSAAQLVTTSVQHTGFGHGQWACPGRFFAANEIKILLCHLLLKFDWKLAEHREPTPVYFGLMVLPDPTAKLLIKRRRAEIDLGALA